MGQSLVYSKCNVSESTLPVQWKMWVDNGMLCYDGIGTRQQTNQTQCR